MTSLGKKLLFWGSPFLVCLTEEEAKVFIWKKRKQDELMTFHLPGIREREQ